MAHEVRKPNWFSIKQAADYLDVGEPTLYRWMRDKRITFRKVGDSTRFLQEDLDAMVSVHPSTVELDKVQLVCPACHHDEMVEGRVQSTGLTYFRPKKTRFWTFLTGNVNTSSRMCTRCGLIVWFGDAATLRDLVLRSPDADAASASGKGADAKAGEADAADELADDDDGYGNEDGGGKDDGKDGDGGTR